MLMWNAVDSRIAIRRELFMQIVTLDEIRILSRLRSRHAAVTRKTAGKPALPTLLSRTVNDLSVKASSKTAKASITKARSQTRQLNDAFDKFETTYDLGDPNISQERLVNILTQAYEFDVESLRVALQSSSMIDPNLKIFLPQAISKLGRYYCVACDLTDAARSSHYTIFRRVKVKVLEEPVLDVRSITKGLLDFDGTLERINGPPDQRQADRYNSRSLSLARTKYHARISNSLTPWKIHAEMQLLFFYEHNADIPSPRFLCSSKSACYLCDLFVKSHSKFRVPRTHGRLYDRWILPEWSTHQSLSSQRIQSTVERFNCTIEGKILQAINIGRPSFHHPNESVVHVREPWSSNSTLPVLETPQSIVEASDDGTIEAVGELEESPPTGLADGSFSTAIAFEERDVEDGEVPRSRVKPDTNQILARRGRSVSQSGPAIVPLSRGDTLCHKLTRQCDSLIVRTDAITLHASWDWDLTRSTRLASGASMTQDDCWIQVKWLAHGSHITGGDRGVDSIDVECADSFQEKSFEGGSALGQKTLSLQRGGHILVIQYSMEDPRCK